MQATIAAARGGAELGRKDLSAGPLKILGLWMERTVRLCMELDPESRFPHSLAVVRVSA